MYLKVMRCIVAIVLILLSLPAEAQESPRTQGSIAFTTGIRQMRLSWNIAGNLQGTSPNVFSELKWNSLRGPLFTLTAERYIWRNLKAKFRGEFSSTVRGTATDTDYLEDNRQSISFTTEVMSNKGRAYRFSPLLGYDWCISKKIIFTLLLGYEIAGEKYHLIDDNTGLNSSYITTWHGPLAGCATDFSMKSTTIGFEFIYSSVSYSAEADWNLLESFMHPVSFRHRAKGYGIEVRATAEIRLTKRLVFLVQGGVAGRNTGTGIDTLFLSDGTIQKTRLNDVTYHWSFASIGGSLSL